MELAQKNVQSRSFVKHAFRLAAPLVAGAMLLTSCGTSPVRQEEPRQVVRPAWENPIYGIGGTRLSSSTSEKIRGVAEKNGRYELSPFMRKYFEMELKLGNAKKEDVEKARKTLARFAGQVGLRAKNGAPKNVEQAFNWLDMSLRGGKREEVDYIIDAFRGEEGVIYDCDIGSAILYEIGRHYGMPIEMKLIQGRLASHVVSAWNEGGETVLWDVMQADGKKAVEAGDLLASLYLDPKVGGLQSDILPYSEADFLAHMYFGRLVDIANSINRRVGKGERIGSMKQEIEKCRFLIKSIEALDAPLMKEGWTETDFGMIRINVGHYEKLATPRQEKTGKQKKKKKR